MEPILAAAEILRAMRNHVVTLISVAKWEFDKLGQVSPTTSVIPLENGIQVTGMGMDPGFHRGDDKVATGHGKAGSSR